jgi:hypothetical protein
MGTNIWILDKKKFQIIMQSGPCETKLLMVKKNCYCIFSVYFVTGTKNPDISQEGTFWISK